MFTKAFWRDTAERAIKTFAQYLAVSLTGGAIGAAVNILTIPWQASLGMAAGAGIVSALTSIGSAPFGATGTPSLVGTTYVPEHAAPPAP